ncbi:MAG: helix-turn-helix domain-containing protein [Nitrospiraceae bacterium]|nr:helix-turn-helix domain-containing protein [Nitrospiraceae bacterium]
MLKVSVKSLQAWRVRGGGPRFLKIGRCVRYALSDLEAFVQAAVRSSTSDPGPAGSGRPRIRVEHLLEQTGRAPIRLTAAPLASSPRSGQEHPALSTLRRHAIPCRRRRVVIGRINQD